MEETWKRFPIKGYEKYEISSKGNCRLNGVLREKKRRKAYGDYINKYLYYYLKGEGKEQRYIKVSTMMAVTFLGMPMDCIAYVKDGNEENLNIENIAWTTPEEFEKRTGVKRYKRKRKIGKLNSEGKVVKIYDSLKDTERGEMIHENSLIRHCNGKAKSAINGFTYFYVGDSQSLKRSMERVKHEH